MKSLHSGKVIFKNASSATEFCNLLGFSHPLGFYTTKFDLVLTSTADLDGWQVNLDLMRHFSVHCADVIRIQLAVILLRSMRMDCHPGSI